MPARRFIPAGSPRSSVVAGLLTAACASSGQQASLRVGPDTVRVVDTVVVERGIDPNVELQQQVARLQLQLLEREAQVDGLQGQLDEARLEVVRSMARLQTLASRAEAASGIAEAEIALEGLRAAGSGDAAEARQAAQLIQLSTEEFNRQNYGGSLYLATQAKTLATAGEVRLSSGERRSMLAGETLFALPLDLVTARRSNVRGGPGLDYDILFTLESDTRVVGHSYTDQWVRITTDDGQSGWIFHSLVVGREAAEPD